MRLEMPGIARGKYHMSEDAKISEWNISQSDLSMYENPKWTMERRVDIWVWLSSVASLHKIPTVIQRRNNDYVIFYP